MLVLLRRTGERLRIELPGGMLVEIEVLGVQGRQVRIGITAPRDIKILRAEILARDKTRAQLPGDDDACGNR